MPPLAMSDRDCDSAPCELAAAKAIAAQSRSDLRVIGFSLALGIFATRIEIEPHLSLPVDGLRPRATCLRHAQ
jgi:hypothetical protein